MTQAQERCIELHGGAIGSILYYGVEQFQKEDSDLSLDELIDKALQSYYFVIENFKGVRIEDLRKLVYDYMKIDPYIQVGKFLREYLGYNVFYSDMNINAKNCLFSISTADYIIYVMEADPVEDNKILQYRFERNKTNQNYITAITPETLSDFKR